MKQKVLSLCLAIVMILTTVVGTAPANVVQAEEPLGPITFEVEGELGVEGSGAWEVSTGKELDKEGNEVGYLQVSTTRYANGRWIVNFPYAGTYQMQMVMAVPTLTSNIHLEWAPEGTDSFTTVNGNIPGITQTEPNEYKVFEGPELVVEEAGNYDLKFGSWAEGGDFKLDKFIFTCDSPIAPPDVSKPFEVKKGESLILKENMSVNKNGSLKTNPAFGDYADYAIKVEESGRYTLTYNLAANSGDIADAFQILVAPKKEGELKNEDFTIQLDPVQMTHYYSAIQERQSVYLEAGEYILRTKALNEGFSLTQLTIADQIVHNVTTDEPCVVSAVSYHNGTDYHAIENNGADIGYAAPGLGLDYELNVENGGVYNISYQYAANGDYSLTAKQLADGQEITLGTTRLTSTAETGKNWYATYVDSEPEGILLPEGTYTLRIRWESNDTNLKAFTLTYAGTAVEFVNSLLTDLPETEELALEDKAAVEKASNAYQALTDEEKEEIDAELVEKLNASLNKISQLELAQRKEELTGELEREFEKYNSEDYWEDKWEMVVAAKDAGMQAIAQAETADEAEKALRDAREAMAAVVQKLKAIVLTDSNKAILAQSKAYRKNGSLNNQVQAGNYADYYVDVQEAGDYTFTWALYSDEATEDAILIQYDKSEYPEALSGSYGSLDVPKVAMNGNRVREIRTTVSLEAGEQTIRFVAAGESVRLNRVTIQKRGEKDIALSQTGEARVIQASEFTEAGNSYLIENDTVIATEAGTTLDYPVALEEQTSCFVAYYYAYAGSAVPELVLSAVREDGSVSQLAVTRAASTNGTFQDSEQAEVVLPAGHYTLRVTMKNDGVDMKSFCFSKERKHVTAEGIWLNAHKVTMDPKSVFQLIGTVIPENTNSKILWSSDNPSVATVDSTGMITAVKGGTAVITATVDGKSAVCRVTVTGEASQEEPTKPTQRVPSFIGKVQVSSDLSTLYVGGNVKKSTKMHVVIPTGAKLAKAEYSSSNAKVAAVSASGKITAKKKGKATITAKITLTNGESISISKQITVKKAYIQLKKKKPSVKVGKSITLKGKAVGSAKKVTFKLAKKKGAKVGVITKNGKFTGKSKGTVKILASAGKVKKTFKVKVK